MHEQFHKYFEESGYRKRADITEELIDIYNEFIEKINAEPEKYKTIIEWIAKIILLLIIILIIFLKNLEIVLMNKNLDSYLQKNG